MAQLVESPIVEESFALIDQEFGPHHLTPAEYAVVRRVIHSTADFDFKHLVHFSPGAIAAGVGALRAGCPLLVDVTMVRQGIASMVQRTFQNPLLTAVTLVERAAPGRTRTETGLLQGLTQVPGAIVVIGNAPTALLSLCDQIEAGATQPALVVGAPVGFVAVEAAKQRLAQQRIPQIRVEGRKGGSAVAAAIVNALLVMAWQQSP
ncbi:MAG: precorrin-8X methylmutase [Cyanobacteria bacterium REEB459]|nr:precorrin-8X methylmutase [Cyanobacteria bacterium REEB459]